MFALGTGILFSRFASDRGVDVRARRWSRRIGRQAFMFRVTNAEQSARRARGESAVLAHRGEHRSHDQLTSSGVVVFPLSWTVCIDDEKARWPG
jgi:hypothetical protein